MIRFFILYSLVFGIFIDFDDEINCLYCEMFFIWFVVLKVVMLMWSCKNVIYFFFGLGFVVVKGVKLLGVMFRGVVLFVIYVLCLGIGKYKIIC